MLIDSNRVHSVYSQGSYKCWRPRKVNDVSNHTAMMMLSAVDHAFVYLTLPNLAGRLMINDLADSGCRWKERFRFGRTFV